MTSSSFTSTIILSFIIALTEAAPGPLRKSVTPTITVLDSTSRWEERWVEGTCYPTDFECMNRRGLALINELRDGASVPPLRLGTKGMLDNAMEQSRTLARMGKLVHQSLNVRLCGSDLMAENISKNHIFLADRNKQTDPTKMCIVQFKNSPGHYKNMISPSVSFFTMGVFINEDGYFYCTQTFWTKVKYGKGECSEV